MRHSSLFLLICAIATCGSSVAVAQSTDCPAIRTLKPVVQQTMTGLGSAQGIFLQYQTGQAIADIWLYGDAQTGVAHQYKLQTEPMLKLVPTGRHIQFTRKGIDVAPHPTGWTHRPGMPMFLGDTVNQKGLIFTLNPQVWNQSTLDGVIENTAIDDLSLNGTRPEYVRYKNKWVIATTEYGDEGNELRLYDPEALTKVTRASNPHALIAKWPCGPWTQTLHWVDEFQTLVFVQNQIAGLKYRLVCAKFIEGQLQQCQPVDLPFPVDELEGFAYLGGKQQLCLLLSSSRKQNVTFAQWIEEK